MNNDSNLSRRTPNPLLCSGSVWSLNVNEVLSYPSMTVTSLDFPGIGNFNDIQSISSTTGLGEEVLSSVVPQGISPPASVGWNQGHPESDWTGDFAIGQLSAKDLGDFLGHSKLDPEVGGITELSSPDSPNLCEISKALFDEPVMEHSRSVSMQQHGQQFIGVSSNDLLGTMDASQIKFPPMPESPDTSIGDLVMNKLESPSSDIEVSSSKKRRAPRRAAKSAPSPPSPVKKPKMYESDKPEAKNARAAKQNREKQKLKQTEIMTENEQLKAQLKAVQSHATELERTVTELKAEKGLGRIIATAGHYLVNAIRGLALPDRQLKVEIPPWFFRVPLYANNEGKGCGENIPEGFRGSELELAKQIEGNLSPYMNIDYDPMQHKVKLNYRPDEPDVKLFDPSNRPVH